MLSLILPTYNESKNLPLMVEKVTDALKGIPFEVIVVDDNSPDGTWRIAQEISRKQENVRVIRRVGRRGLSSAVIEGFLSAKGDVLAVADADGQHDLGLLPKLYESVKAGNGISVGSRYTEGGSVGQWDERRHTMSRIATRMAMSLCAVRVSDPMSGFFAIDKRVFEEVLPRLNPMGFKILLDLLVHLPKSVQAKEIPFTFGVREHGESKLSRKVQIEFLEYLYDATFGRFLPLTLVEYCVVGVMGVIVNLAVYFAMRTAMGDTVALPALPVLGGIEAAIIFNFFLNNSWTFSRARLRGAKAVTGFVNYNVVCAFGAFANYAATSFLYAHGQSAIMSLVFGAFLGMVWNYTVARMFTWKA